MGFSWDVHGMFMGFNRQTDCPKMSMVGPKKFDGHSDIAWWSIGDDFLKAHFRTKPWWGSWWHVSSSKMSNKIVTKIFAEKLKSPGQKELLLHRTGQDTACVAQGLLAGAQEPFLTAPLCFRARWFSRNHRACCDGIVQTGAFSSYCAHMFLIVLDIGRHPSVQSSKTDQHGTAIHITTGIAQPKWDATSARFLSVGSLLRLQ